MVRKSRVRLRAASSRICPASSTPVGPAPTMTKVIQKRSSASSVMSLGQLERAVDTTAQLHGVIDRLHARRDQCELVVAEVGLPRAGRHDEAVVGELVEASRAATVVCTTLRSRSNPVTEERMTRTFRRFRIMWRRTGEICPGERTPGGDLIEQRLEEVVVAPVDQRDLNVLGPGQESGGGRPPKPPPTTTTRCGSRPGSDSGGRGAHSGGPRSLGLNEPTHRVDERQVGEGLREVAEMLPGGGVDLFRVELERTGEGQQLLAQCRAPAPVRRSWPARSPARRSRW